MLKKLKFTTNKLRALPCNDKDSSSTDLEFSDTEVSGLKCLSGKNGSKRFLFRYRYQGRKGSIAIGRFPDVDLSTARKVARQHKGLLAEGINPKAKRDAVNTFPTVYDFFWNTYLPLAKKHKRSWQDDVSRFKLHCKSLFSLPYNEVTAHQIMQLHLKMSESSSEYRPYAPSTCNRVLALIKTMGKLANQLLDITNVADKVSLLPEDNARTRYCTIDEIKRLIGASLAYKDIYAGSLIALLFLLGCRESELRLRKWSDVDLYNKTIRVPRTKNGSYHILYLSDLMLDIINKLPRVKGNPYMFVGRFKRGCINRP
ncbi:tyrosine-type recombinase/integrase [Psychromonas hadalis]|uniref:tyrosine-type recombinase/integrase n=1 Tax=Psychromonas hadalis TaxID=211669 RepID=UPI0003B710D9|nr:integrase arm-type DNA-binding domain-containing protein [Psychromonas hadalis]